MTVGLRAGAGWELAPCDEEAAARLAAVLDLHPAAARVLAVRGVTDPDQAAAFLTPRLDQLADPFTMHGMDRAVDRILTAVSRREQVLIYGDYDVDGVCAAATLWEALREIGAAAEVYIPHRVEEGYGLHAEALEAAARRGVSLVITVDTGIAAVEEARRAAELGLDLIISDHHALPPTLPAALAVLHPRHPEGRYSYPDLSGAGVAWRLVDALARRLSERAGAGRRLDPQRWLDLAALAAVADVMPLTGENRVLVALGLERLRANPRPGAAALAEVAGVDRAALNTRDIGFGLAPRLNAAGRMGDARIALDLLTAGSPAAAAPLAQALDAENRARQRIQDEILQEARGRAAADPRRVVLLSDPAWHPGVVGIVAARLCEELGRPVLLACEAGGVVQGSARSHPGFDITAALAECADLLDTFGGHELAAGFRLAAGDVPELARRLDDLYRGQVGEAFRPAPLRCDAVISVDDIDDRLAGDLDRLAPFGEAHPEPVFWLRAAPVIRARAVGRDGSHLKLEVGGQGRRVDGIAFGWGELAAEFAAGGGAEKRYGPGAWRTGWNRPGLVVDAAVRLRRNAWQGRRRLELHVTNLGPVTPAPAPAAPRDHPERRVLAALFRALRHLAQDEAGALTLEHAVDRLSRRTSLAPRDVRRGLAVFDEVGLLEVDAQGRVRLRQVPGKADLEQSPTYRRMVAARLLREQAGEAQESGS